MSLPRIIGHRGASWARPENTAAAFDLALEEGADGLELDLQLTRDEQVVVFHDKTLSKLGAKHRRIAQYTRAELHQLDVGAWFGPEFAGAAMLDLDEVLERYGDRTDLYLEIKPVGELQRPEWALRLARRVARQALAHAHQHRLYLLSFSDPVLQEVRRMEADLRCVRNLLQPAELGAMSASRLHELHAVCVDIRHFQPSHLEHLQGGGPQRFAYTVDRLRDLRAALALGVDAVISNGPARAREQLRALLSGQA